MEQFPKIARARMTAQATGEHPEAELLNAFAENALLPKERESILTHLGVCADCREIVSLAAEARPEGAPLAKPVRAGFRWATLQWAAVAASVAIVTVAVLVVGPKQTSYRTESGPVGLKRQPAEAPPATLPVPSQAPAAAAPAQSNSVEASNQGTLAMRDLDAKPKLQVQKKKADAQIASGTGLESGYVADGVRITDGGFGGIGVYSKSKSQPTDELAKSADKKETPAKPAVPSRGVAGLFYASPGGTAGKPVNSTNLPPATVPAEKISGAAATTEITASAPTVTDGERAATMQSNARKDPKDGQKSVATSANLTDTFYQSIPVQRAAGHVAEADSAPGGAVLARSVVQPLLWRVAQGKLQSSADAGSTWRDQTPAKGAQWTSVASSAQQVWAGGPAGALYHSADAGQTWKKISLTGDVIIPLADVVDIKITTPQIFDVVLSSGQDWQTNNGGDTFRLLPRKP